MRACIRVHAHDTGTAEVPTYAHINMKDMSPLPSSSTQATQEQKTKNLPVLRESNVNDGSGVTGAVGDVRFLLEIPNLHHTEEEEKKRTKKNSSQLEILWGLKGKQAKKKEKKKEDIWQGRIAKRTKNDRTLPKNSHLMIFLGKRKLFHAQPSGTRLENKHRQGRWSLKPVQLSFPPKLAEIWSHSLTANKNRWQCILVQLSSRWALVTPDSWASVEWQRNNSPVFGACSENETVGVELRASELYSDKEHMHKHTPLRKKTGNTAPQWRWKL